MQLISLMKQIFSKTKKKKLWLRSYEIMATGHGCGLVEFVEDALSIDYIRQKLVKESGTSQVELEDYFRLNFGLEGKQLT